MKKPVLIAVAALGLIAALTPTNAGARQAFDTDVELVFAQSAGATDWWFFGSLNSAKNQCFRNRKVTVAGYLPGTGKRRETGPVLDTDFSSHRGAWAFKVDTSMVPQGWAYKVVTKAKDLKDGDRCRKGSLVFET